MRQRVKRFFDIIDLIEQRMSVLERLVLKLILMALMILGVKSVLGGHH